MVFGRSKKEEIHGMAEADANAAVETAPMGEVPDGMEKNVVLPSHDEEMDEGTAERRLRMFREAVANDPNIDINDLGHIDSAVAGHDAGKEHLLIDSLVENSPYPEVRAAVRNYDVDVPCSTMRAWFIGMLLTTIASGLNMLFSLRAESISITSYVAQLVSYPLGVGLSYILPNHQFNVLGLKFNFNPGPWNFKEHAIIVIMANASYGGGAAYFTDILTAQKVFFGMNLGVGYAILLGLTTQILGFSLAGLFRIWLVEPASMIWPQDLVNVAFMYALHDHSRTDPTTSNGWRIGRYRWFLYVFAASFCWYWIPGFVFQALSQFAFATWIAPNNVNVNKVFGTFSGMALLPITFDWTMVTAFTNSPLIPPWHALANIGISVVVFFWIICAGWNWSGAFYSNYLPYSASGSFDNTASPYNVSMILTPDFRLDEAKYKAYSPLFLSTTFSMAYALSFAALPALILHTVLNYGKEIWLRWKDKNHDLDDIHAKMMRKYNPVPNWWFLILFAIAFALSFVTCYVWDTGLTWWAYIISLIIAVVWLLPIGIVQAVTNIQLGLNVFTEFLIGYMLPGRPTAMMMFKTYGYISMSQALAFISDMKLGHYLKLPPRTVFTAQVIATVWSTFVQVGVFYWATSGVFKDVCTPAAQADFTCPNGRVFFTASIIFGVIGPQRIFTGNGIYKNLMWFWLIGAAVPVIFWLIRRRYPYSFVRYLNAPVIFTGTGLIPPATAVNYLSFVTVGFIFNKWIRDKWRGWWMRFNYVTSAGLDSGLAISTIVIILTLSMTNTAPPNWWGNNVVTNTMDYNGTAVKIALNPGETFGPAPGSW